MGEDDDVESAAPVTGEVEREPRRTPVREAASPGYDVFLSYGHARDARLAPTLQRELERFAKPWYRIRALRVFLDDASLTANPGLWSAIERALASSEWFVLMASPDAADSPWVDREVGWWVANRSVSRLLIVLTDGELTWDESDGRGAAGSALPPALRSALREEPRWVDLRWLRRAEQVDPANPRLRDAVAEVAAAVRGVPKDALVGEHLQHHRRAIRLARAGVSTLVILLVATLFAAAVAVVQRDNALTEARIAKARQLAALSVANLATHLDLAQLLAVEAYRLNQDDQTRSALFQAVTTSPHLVRYLPAGTPVTKVTGSADGNVVLAGTTDGHVLRWDLARGAHSSLRLTGAPITSLATDTHGNTVAAADGAIAVQWDVATGHRRTIHSGRSDLVTSSPSGRRLAVLDQAAAAAVPADDDVGLTLYDGDTGRQLARTSLRTQWTTIGLPDDDTVLLVGGEGAWERRSAADLAVAASSTSGLTPANSYIAGYSADGRYYGYDVVGKVLGWDLASSPGNTRFDDPDLQAATNAQATGTEAFTISGDGTRVATAAAGTVYVSAVGGPETASVPLRGNDGVNAGALAFVGDRRLAAATGDLVSLWDVTSPGRFGTDLGVQLPYGCRACPPRLTPSPDGHQAAFVSVDQAAGYRLDGPAAPGVFSPPGRPPDSPFPDAQTVPVWSTDSTRLALVGLGNGSALLWDPDQPRTPVGHWPPAVPGTDPVTARVSADGSEVVVVSSHGDVVVRRFSGGAVKRIHSGTTDLDAIGFPPPEAAASVSYDLQTAALVEQGSVTLVEVRSGARRALPGGPGRGVLFTRDRLLVLRETDALEVWDVTGTHLLTSVPGTGGYQQVLAAPPRGAMVARLRADNTVTLSQLDSGVQLGSFPLPAPQPSQTVLAFTPDGTELLVGAADGGLTRWEMTEPAWLRIACDTAGRSLSPAEWRRYVDGDPPADLRCAR